MNAWRLGGTGFRAFVTLFAPIALTAIGCGGSPSVTTRDRPIATGGSAGSGTGGTGNGTGGTSVVGVGNMGGQNENPEGGMGGAPAGICGDGILEAGELCDDANTDDDDGCSADCTRSDPDYICTEGQPCVRVVTCGNGVIEGDEVCDDGNEESGDGCSAGCDGVEDGYVCVKPGEPCVALPVCGNAEREHGEQCDDGNDKSGDGCSDTCELEDGYFCPPGQACVKLECGDGRRTPDESCDDGNTKNGDGCSSKCAVEDGWLCGTSGCKPVCGDGRLLGAEECDDGNNASGDGCSAGCQVEPFFECTKAEPSVCTSTIVCGDGMLGPGEECDPGITGESACYGSGALACKGYDTGLVDPAVCNNGVIEYGETCDGNVPGCTNCQADDGYACPAPNVCIKVAVCGDGQIQAGEECDTGFTNVAGCSSSCKIQGGYYCTGEPSTCTAIVCGDGKIEPGESCDDGNTSDGDGCSGDCTTIDTTHYKCVRPGKPCIPICGDGVIEGTEQCDIENATGTDATACVKCRLAAGYTCGAGGTGPCSKTVCGNATAPSSTPGSTAYVNTAKANAEPGEGCDDGNTIAGDGCGPTCQLEPKVTTGTNPSVAVTCGDGLVTGTEECDDGNTTGGDGCSYIAPNDAGNCKIETGWSCAPSVTYPSSVAFKITYRNFEQRDQSGGHPHMKVNGPGSTTGWPNGGGTPANSPAQGVDPGITGDVCTTANTDKNGATGSGTCGKLDIDGKPLYVGNTDTGGAVYNGGAYPGTAGGIANILPTPGMHPTIDTTGDGTNLDEAYHKAAFKLWYADSNAVLPDALSQAGGTPSHLISVIPNPPTVPAPFDTLTLTQVTGTPTAYRYSCPGSGCSGTGFFPLDGRGTNPPSQTHNFQFTSELRYFFQYQGGETLTFFGDDDVWVFINGRLAVDIGGIHAQLNGRVVLGDDGDGTGNTDSDCSVQGANNNNQGTLAACTLQTNENNGDDKRFGLTKGGVYEIVVFQAERHPTGSNYQLTLDGFLAPRSTCSPVCGPNPQGQSPTVTVTPPEECDDGANNTATPTYGKCTATTCVLGPYCGDHTQNGPEQCDDGTNLTQYGTSGCAPGCVTPPHCGDGVIQPDHEQCDNGGANADGLYGGCTTQCQLGPYCGDGAITNGEACDTPGMFATYGAGKCNYDCQPAPYCGDGIRNGAELCDGTPGCNSSCEFDAFCGDGVKESGEDCDYGMFNQSSSQVQYGGCTTSCTFGPSCGDGVLQADDGEECDDGSKNSDSNYDGCTTACLLGPRCGDGVRQKSAEACDNGFNDDTYEYPGDTNACGPKCKAPPSCGDGVVQSAFELCDNGSQNSDTAYDGCNTVCEWGPYCGDGTKSGPEDCDDGIDNTAYSADGSGCSYQCTKNVPYCGDGVRNGPEQCDDGSGANHGQYGGCNADCTKAAYCGDKVVQRADGEQCDDGPTGSFTCTNKCKLRTITR